jgi:hypothetical protein
VSVGKDGVIRIPFLAEAENCFFHLDGGPQKIGGTARINSTELNSGAKIRGLVDFFVLATGAHHRVVHAGNDLMADAADGTFASIDPGTRNTSAVVSYAVFDDELIIMSDKATEVPLKWTGTGDASALGTNTPDCAFGVTHKNRFFMAGSAVGSRLYYSEPLPAGAGGDWDAVEAGFIDIDPDDGDEIRGVISHKEKLWIFKGPNIGSIHVLSGDTPLGGVTAFASSTQPEPYSLQIFVRGLGAAGQNSIFRFRDDIGFIDAKTASIRSLNATAQFGDFREVALSFPINDWLLENVNPAQLKKAWAVSDVANGRVLVTLATGSSTTNKVVISMDHRFETPRWSKWPAIEAECMALVIDSDNSNRQSVFIGDTDGFVRRTNTANRKIDNGSDGEIAINYKVKLPYIDYGNPIAMKTLARASVGIRPRGNYTGTFSWSRDRGTTQSVNFDQSGGDVLGGTGSTPHVFTLGASQLGGGDFIDRFFSLEEGGEFRSIQYMVTQTGIDEDLDLHSFFTEVELGADSMET